MRYITFMMHLILDALLQLMKTDRPKAVLVNTHIILRRPAALFNGENI